MADHPAQMPSRKNTEAPPFWLALVLLDAAILVPAVIAQVWWRSAGMCSGDGFGCGRAALYVAAPAVVIGIVLVVGPYLGAARPLPRRAVFPVVAGLAIWQVFNAIPVDATLNDGCNLMTGRTVRALKLDRGPFEESDVPILGPASVTQAACGPPGKARWRWGTFPAGELLGD